MNWTDLNLSVVLPEIVLLTTLFGVLLLDLWTSDDKRYITHVLSIGALLVAAVTQFAVWSEQATAALHNMYIADGVSQFAKIVVYLGTAVVFALSKPYNQIHKIFKGEYYTLALFAVVGMSVMISAGHFLSAYLGLELLSLSLYAMIALNRDSKEASEAALKYFVLGALASGFLLYGISMVYGATGSLSFAQIAEIAASNSANPWLLKLGVLFIVAAIAFKFGAVPFHMWVADVYQGSPISVAAFVGSVPKIAAVVFSIRLLVGGLLPQSGEWVQMFAILAVASLLVGNLAAIMQTNIKRMLAFSTVSHMGFVLLAFLGKQIGLEAALYYATAYIVMSVVGFGVLMLLSRENQECQEISDLSGLNQRNAWYALVMLLVMFSMAGIPPLMGFYAKFAVLRSVWVSDYSAIAIFAVIMSLIGAFYYLRVVKTIYFDEANDNQVIIADNSSKIILSITALLLLIWGVFPEHLMGMIKVAVSQAGLGW